MKTLGVGDVFQIETKYGRGQMPRGGLDWNSKPETYKSYPDAPKIALSAPQKADGPGLWDAIQARRSVRRFAGTPLKETHLSQLLWATQGITRLREGFAFRAAPSAGALYPIETYLVVHNVEGTAPGLYHYGIERHELEQLQVGDLRMAAAQAALDQEMVYHANVLFVWTGLFERSKWKYRQRAYRYVYLDAGHIAENLALAAVALGLGSCQIAALYDDEANALLGVDGIEESAVYMSIVGTLD
jgi:SagB-type dehydrogenase family enzyme